MSQGQNLIERPKVRFCQPSEDFSTTSEKPEETFHASSNKPRIRSIVTLEDPFKIIYKNGELPSSSKGIGENIDSQYSSKSTPNAQSSSDANFQRPSSRPYNSNSRTLSSNKPGSPDLQKSLPSTNNLKNTTQQDNSGAAYDANGNGACRSTVLNNVPNCKSTSSTSNIKSLQCDASKSRSKNSLTISVPCSVSTGLKNTAIVKNNTISKPEKICASKIGARYVTPKTVPCTAKKVAKKTNTVTNENVVSSKNPVCRSNVTKINLEKEKNPGKLAMPCSSRNPITAKTVSCGLKIPKPGAKVWKTRSKSSPVKKTILRDVNGHPTNAYIGPGVARYYSQPFKMNLEKETPHIRPDIVSGEKLGRPEYNSIMCTIDELKKVEAEKFITDVDHLPLVYRNLVNEKVSAALDFLPDEAIYKNLVDLSVNENQLPSRLTRSKDPEPRHRDVVPKLSDFFTPTYSEEYCTAVQIRPSSAEIISNWSAFAISDKIFGWKHDMDQCY